MSASRPPNELPNIARLLDSSWGRFRKRAKQCRRKLRPRTVHDLRVACRRLIAIFDLLPDRLIGGRSSKIRRALKRHLDAFGSLRDVQVQLRAVEVLQRQFPAARDFHEYLRAFEKKIYRQARKDAGRLKTRRLGKWISNGLHDLGEARLGRSQFERGIRRAFERAVSLLDTARSRDTTAIHRARVAFKKFRYMAETFDAMHPHLGTRTRDAFRRYQGLMGGVQDATILLESFDAFAGTAKVRSPWAGRLRRELYRRRERAITDYLGRAGELRGFLPVTSMQARPLG